MKDEAYVRTIAVMGTLATIKVVGTRIESPGPIEREEAVERSFEWFRRIEACCSRFDDRSEVMQLTAQIGVAVPVSTILYEAVAFALAVAAESAGAFDPTIGLLVESRGFNRNYRTGRIVTTGLDPGPAAISYRDVRLDGDRRTITLQRPLILDLGAVAKGLAIDMGARELASFKNYAIDAGGDLFLAGCNVDGEPWSIGIRHPRTEGALIDVLKVSDRAVCTSGDYERRAPGAVGGHHILDPRTGSSADAAVSVTVAAPTAMVADALATAAFVLGPADGIELLERHGVDGLIVSPTLERFATRGMSGEILSNAKGTSDHRADASHDAGGARRGDRSHRARPA